MSLKNSLILKTKKTAKLSLALILSLQISACKFVGDPLLEQNIQSLSQNESLSPITQKLSAQVDNSNRKTKKTLKSAPNLISLEAEQNNSSTALSQQQIVEIHYKNTQKMQGYLAKSRDQLLTLTQDIKDLSRLKYQPHPTRLSVNEVSELEVLLFMNLLTLRDFSLTQAKILFDKLHAFDADKFDSLPENEEIKKEIFAEYLSALSMSKITENDITKTVENLAQMRDQNMLSAPLMSQIDNLITKLIDREKKQSQQIQSVLKESLTDKAHEALAQAIEQYEANLAGKSFLFDPAMPDHPAIHLLVIVSNLSWGLVNSLIGLGFVVTAAIAAPVTQIAGAIIRSSGHYPAFYVMKFPRIKVAANRMQLYADVCGLGFIPSKMSAGLFELDFCTNYNFASAHEGGHAKQSAILGPLYFPAAILSYIINGGHGGFIESWADKWYVRSN